MKTYLISYDLRQPGRNYTNLIAEIKSLSGSWCHCLESVWLIKHSGSASIIIDRLLPHIDKNDALVVIEVTSDAAWYGLDEERTKWMKRSLFAYA